jgi:GNAT superfamily N-acetyltransferase
MSEAEWVGLDEIPSIADYAALNALENGSPPVEQKDTWAPQNLAELDDEPPVRPTLGEVGIVYPGKRHVFSGPQESAKTLAAYVIGLEVIRAGQSIVLIDFEMGQWDARRRLIELGATMPELAAIAYVEPSERAEGTVIERLVALEPGLVIIDAAAGAFDIQALDDNKRQDVERFARVFVHPFWRAGIATIVLDHVVKNAEARGKYAIGSERKVGGADVHLGFEVVTPIKRGGHGLYKIVTHKDRGGFLKRGKLAEFELVSDPQSHAIRWTLKAPAEGDEEHPFRPTTLMEKVSRYLELQPDPVPMGAVEEAVSGSRDYVRLAIQTLVDDGFVVENPGPRKARMMEIQRAYREENDLSGTSPDLSSGEVTHDLSSSPNPLRGGEVEGEVSSRQESLIQHDLSSGEVDDDDIPF